MYKIVTFAPEKEAEIIRRVMAEAGAGMLGNYEHCTFSVKGTGRFKGNENSNPTVGEKNKIEEVSEERIETWVQDDKLKEVIKAIKDNHSYEEVPIDVYKLEKYD